MMYGGKIINTTTESTPRDVANGLMVFSTGSSAIESIGADAVSGRTEWYSVDGMRYDSMPDVPGIYIRRQGAATEKVFIGK